MKVLEIIGAFLHLVFFILTWRINATQEKEVAKKQLEVEADAAIRSGDMSAILAVYNKLRK